MGSTKTLPFHLAVVQQIRDASGDELKVLGRLLRTTTIPANHDTIAEAWEERCTDMCFPAEEIAPVATAVRGQRSESNWKTASGHE